MIDIAELSGLPLNFDIEKESFGNTEEISYDHEYYVPLQDISPILLNKYLRYPERVYKHYRNVRAAKDEFRNGSSYDVVYLPFGLLGIEFIKTHVFYSQYCEGKCGAIIEVLYGNLTVIIQKNREKEDPYEFETYVDDINIITLKRGEKLVIPSGYYYTFVNTGIVPVIFSKLVSKGSVQIDYNTLRRERGLAYFLISKNAKIEIVANPKYKIKCKLKCATLRRLLSDSESPFVRKETHSNRDPLYRMFLNDVLSDFVLA